MHWHLPWFKLVAVVVPYHHPVQVLLLQTRARIRLDVVHEREDALSLGSVDRNEQHEDHKAEHVAITLDELLQHALPERLEVSLIETWVSDDRELQVAPLLKDISKAGFSEELLVVQEVLIEMCLPIRFKRLLINGPEVVVKDPKCLRNCAIYNDTVMTIERLIGRLLGAGPARRQRMRIVLA